MVVEPHDYDVTKFFTANPVFRFRSDRELRVPVRGPATAAAIPTSNADNTQCGLYLQDDWNPTARLTLNAGIRWDYETTSSTTTT